ncbi:hypothetical protein V6X57_06720 [Serratia bockelmannii]|nr:hypothetical protein [Serratia bockelmannii]MBH3102540.1 hypothetical protein [Serratia marcescens]MCW7608572.1 hypothetical protein [Serratia bockelmannii]HAV5984686.1 hypothetical protein [Serratia marcescens]
MPSSKNGVVRADLSKRSFFHGLFASLVPIALLSSRSSAAVDSKIDDEISSVLSQHCQDINSLRNMEPVLSNQSVIVNSYYADNLNASLATAELSIKSKSSRKYYSSIAGGGEFYYDPSDATSPDDGGMVIVTKGGRRWKRKISGSDKIQAAFYGVSPLIDDNGPLLQSAFNFSSNRIIELPRGTITIKTPIIFNLDSGVKIEGSGKKGGTVINVLIADGYENMGALHFSGRNKDGKAEPGYRALSIKNIHLIGNFSRCRGVFLQYQFAMRLEQVTIEKFDGAGLYIDKCQDSVFEQVDVFNCGRTSGNRASLKDSFDEAKTIDSPIVITSTISKDDSNYLRFTNCQWEDNPVSPVCDFSGGIENYFVNLHAEYSAHWNTKGTAGGTLFKQRKGTIKIQGGGSDEIKKLVDMDWGEFWVESHRCNPPKTIKVKRGTNSRLTFKDIALDSVNILTTSGEKRFEGCTINTVDLDYPDGYINFSSCNIKKGFLTKQSGNSNKIFVTGCRIDGDMIISKTTKSVLVDDCFIDGNVIFGSDTGMWLNNAISGNFTLVGNRCKVVIPSTRKLIGVAPPTVGSFNVGDLLVNTSPTPGGVIGWVCVKNGNPGEWRGYGKIES